MAKASKQGIIDLISKHLQNGKGRGEVLSIVVKKWQMSDRSFDRYWKIVNIEYQKRQELASNAADAVYIKGKEDAAKLAVMSKSERLEQLSKIARGERITLMPGIEGSEPISQPVFVETLEMIKAMAEISKMEGDYAATKVAQTNSKGEDVTNLSDNQFIQLINAVINAPSTDTGQ